MKLKRLLASLGALVMATSASASLVACGPVNSARGENTQAVSDSITANLSYQTQDRKLSGIDEASTIGELATQEAQILLLASQFGLSQDELVKVSGLDTKTFLENFDLTSLQALTKDKSFHRTLGQKGAIISVTGKDNFEIKNSIANKILDGALGKRHVTGTNYSSQELAQTVDYFLDLAYPFMRNANFAQAIKGISGVLNFVSLNPKDAKFAQDETAKIVKSEPVEKYVKPLLAGLINGVDLSRFATVTPAVFMAQMANEIANLLGYATLENYQPITGDTDQVNKASEVINTIVTKKAWNTFSLERNPIQIMETGVTVAAMLNQVFNIFKTSDVLYNGTDLDNHLFSTYMTNDIFMDQLYQKDMKTLVGLDSLKSLNVTELASNFFYFLDAPTAKEGQYRLQKLVYGFLYRGHQKLTPLMEFGVHAAIDIALGKHSGLQEVVNLIGGIDDKVASVVDSFVTNKPLPFKAFFNKTLWKGFFLGVGGVKSALNLFMSGLGDKIQKYGTTVQNTLGDHPFEGLCFNDLRPIIQGLSAFVGADKISPIMQIINRALGEKTPFGIATVRDLTFDKIFYAFGLASFTNPNLPHYFPEFTKKTLMEDLATLENFFGVHGTDSSLDLKLKKIDFTPIILDAQAWLTVPKGEKQTMLETFVGQLDDTDAALDTLGFIDDPRDGIIRRDSVIGHLMAIFMPRIALDTDEEIILEDHYDDADNIMRLALDARVIIKSALAKNKIKPFVDHVMASGAFTVDVPETTMFDNNQGVKSGKVSVHFNQSEISFADGSKLTGKSQTLTLEFSRTDVKEKLQFTKLA